MTNVDEVNVSIYAIMKNGEKKWSYVGPIDKAAERHKLPVAEMQNMLLAMLQSGKSEVRLPTLKRPLVQHSHEYPQNNTTINGGYQTLDYELRLYEP